MRATGRARLAVVIAASVVASGPAMARDTPAAWTRPIAPFHLIGPVDYVGTEGLAAYLIHTSEGAILIDATMAENVPAISRSIVAMGVPLNRVKLILVSHAHFDHAAGDAAMKRATGARLIAGAADATALESGMPPGETSYGVIRFPQVRVDRRVRDGDRVRLGDVTLTAVATPGHTPGCTSWAMRTSDAGRAIDVLFPCSLTVAGNRLFGNRRYPGIVADFRRSIARMATLHPAVVLPGHPEVAGVIGRHRAGTLVAPNLWRALTAKAKTDFDAEEARQRRVAAK